MKTRTWKKLGVIFGIVAIALVLIVLITPKLFNLNRYNDLIVSEIEKAVGGKVDLGHISWGISHVIWLEVDGLSIVDATAFPGDVKLSRIYTNVSIHPLLVKKVVLNKLVLEGDEVKMRLEPETAEAPSSASRETETGTEGEIQTGAPSSKESGAKSPGVHLPVDIAIDQLTIEIGRVELDDALTLPGQTLVRVFVDVGLTATNVVPGEEMAFNLAFRDTKTSGLGRLEAQGAFSGLTDTLTIEDPNLRLKAALTELHMDAIKPYLKNSLLEERFAGSISLDVNYEGDLSRDQRAKGVIDLSRITYTDPSLWDAALPGQKTTVTFQAKLGPQVLNVEKLALQIGSFSLDARADVHRWRKDPVIKNAEFSSDLPLLDLIPLIPWKLLGKSAGIIRPILEDGGKISLSKVVLPEISLAKLPATLEAFLREIEMTAQIAGVSVQPTPNIPKLQNITGSVQLADGVAQVEGLKVRVASTDLPAVSAKITNLLEKPKIDAVIKGRFKVDAASDETLKTLLRKLGLEKLVGAAEVDLAVELETARPENFQVQGEVGLRDFQVKSVFTPALLQGLNADVAISRDAVDISHLSATVVLPAAATSPGGQFNLELAGRVDDWRRKPAITLQNLKTSSVSLPILASVVPWEKLGKSAKTVKESLDAGGAITIDHLALPKIDLSRPPKDPAHLLTKVKLAASFVDLTIPPVLSLPKIEGIAGRVNLENDVLIADNVHGRFGPVSFPTMNFHVTNVARHPKVALRAKGPLQVAATGDAQVEKLLKKYGLKSLSGSAVVDMRADFDQRKPKDWAADGSLVFKGVRAETHPAAVVMDNLQGGVKFSRKRTMNIDAQGITARINQAPVRFSGKLSAIGTPKMLVSVKAYARQLNLAHLADLFPALKDLNLEGMLDMNLDVHMPFATPAKSRLKGNVTTRNAGFRLAAYDLAVEKGNTEIDLIGTTATIKTMTVQLNDQQVTVSGQISNPLEPKARLLVTSPDLNMDRLLPKGKAEKPVSKPSMGKGGRVEKKPLPEKKTKKSELPPLIRKMTADLLVKADRGQYKGLEFQKLKLSLLYAHGVIESYNLNLGIDDGQIDTKGSADLRDLDHITFTVEPDINALHLGKIAPLFGFDKAPLDGPMSLKGQLQGRTGSGKEMLADLDGHLNVEIGPGKLNETGTIGNLFTKILTMTSVQGIFSGRMFKVLSEEGIPFRKTTAQTTFKKGTMNLNDFHFKSDAMDVTSQGTIDLVNQKLNLTALLVPLATVDKTFSLIPIVGKAAANLTKIRIDIEGPLEKPKIRAAEAKQLAEGVGEVPETILKDAAGIGKGLIKLFGK